MPFKIFSFAARCIPGLLLLSLAGCDLGTYESRRAEAAKTVANKVATQNASLQIPAKGNAGTGVSLMLPPVLGKAADIKALAGPLTVDGLVAMYEAANGNGGGPLLLLGGVPTAEGPLDKVVANVNTALQAVAPGQQVQATDVRPGVKRLLVVGPQKFNIGGTEQSVPGRTEAYVVNSATHIAILIFRVTDANDATKAFEGQIGTAINGLQGVAAP